MEPLRPIQETPNLQFLRVTFNTLQNLIKSLPDVEYSTKITLAASAKTVLDFYQKELRDSGTLTIPLNISTLVAATQIEFPDDLAKEITARAKDTHYYQIWTGGNQQRK